MWKQALCSIVVTLSILNVADCGITIGAVLIVLGLMADDREAEEPE